MKTRREFLKTGLALGASLPLIKAGQLFAAEAAGTGAASAAGPRSALVAVRDGSRVAMLERAIAELGGMRAFLKPGQTVVIKPNISFDSPPDYGNNTHPDLLRRLITLCQEAGAKSVTFFDHTLDPWQPAYEASGADRIARETGATLLNGNNPSLYREVAIPGGRSLRSARVFTHVLDGDVFIDVPVLKHHGGARMTAGMKNLMGVVWDRHYYHRNDLHQCIADFVTLRKPTLTVIDAYRPMVRNGPRGRGPGDLVEMRTLLASTDIVAVDAAGAKMLGHQPADIRYVKLAAEMGLGTMDLDRVDIRRITLG